MEDKSPSFCRLCNIALASPTDWRQHAKSDWHVYNLRVRVAEPGTVVARPSSSSSSKASSALNAQKAVDVVSNNYLDDDPDKVDAEVSVEPGFNPGQCLFCGTKNDTFKDNLAHMSTEHSFTIPHEVDLIVERDTLIGYLHLVIYGYRECILCATCRSSVEGIQHHMIAKGHCRFNVTSDTADFYTIPTLEYHVDEELLRLPSGKILSHRTRASGPAVPTVARQTGERRIDAAASQLMTPTHPSHVVRVQDDDTTAQPHTQLSRLTRGDQQSLAHLPNHEVRSLLATSARHIDQLRREEKDAQLKLDTAGNTTLTGHFRMDTSKRFRGPWG
ncbi:transcriptional regulator family: C2H2 zinc finger [Trichoderma aggressivum f. europaeum]|uniref:Transcriptional regulator family: C2H2 zinc finger n=1 Tax=Trichoderma aggressivum f. europaeum TaxID=173218 RepID=A0AAE1LXZ7_9HYPO|nr:transcriptional regulator family: C2H2 zinc finger [Trichoderma aggressivum f. europaeum]